MSEPVHGLSRVQLELLRAVLAPFADRVTEAALFGSRATGAAKPHSDIDLVLYGPLREQEVDRLRTLFDESSLSVPVDVVPYGLLGDAPLKAHIDAVKRPLFSQSDLKIRKLEAELGGEFERRTTDG